MTVVTGYLGSGKTTLVNRLLETTGQRLAVLVNDFGEIAIDDKLIRNRNADTIALTNGCVCCSIGGDLYDAIDRLLRLQMRPERIIVETSGVADPASISMIARAEPELEDTGTLTLADSLNLPSLLGEPRLRDTLERQLRAATAIALTKMDLVTETQSDRMAQCVREIAQSVPILVTAISDPTGLIAMVEEWARDRMGGQKSRAGRLALGPAGHPELFGSWSWSGTQAINKTALEAFVTSAPQFAWRIKGVCRTREGAWYAIHRMGQQMEIQPCEADRNGRTQMLVIGLAAEMNSERLESLWQSALRHGDPSSI
ncbi:MAG: GTP-binding protein [Rhizobiaceae bacterium]